MGATTGIAWTRSTRNFWSGCTKVGPGCDGCYAEASSRRMRGVNETTKQASNWGHGAPRVYHGVGAERDVSKWNDLARFERGAHPKVRAKPGGVFTEGWPRPGFWPVFINSYSDFADNEVPRIWQDHLFTVVEECPDLYIQLVTKRIGNVEGLLAGRWSQGKMPKNIWLIVTVVNQEELDRDGPKLLELTSRLSFPVIGLSMEPQIGPIDVRPFLDEAEQMEQVVWGITGGESSQPGHPARPYDLEWAKTLAQRFDDYEPGALRQAAGHEPARPRRAGHPERARRDDPTSGRNTLRKQEFPV
jgi:protein gp37